MKVHEHLIKWLSKRGCLGYSKAYCDVRKIWFLAWNQNRHITHYIFYIQYTNSEISIGLLYIRPHFAWWHRLNHCAVLVRNLPTSILVHVSASLLTFHTSTILVPLWFTNFECCWFHNLSISTLSNEAVEQHRRFSVAVWKKKKKKTSVSIKN